MKPEEIKQIRKKLGLTQRALASHLGIAFETVCRWEAGKHRPTQMAVKALLELGKGGSRCQSK